MDINPYEPTPPIAEDVADVEESLVGPWRDGMRVVVRIDRPNFPALCLVTCGQQDLQDRPVTSVELRAGLIPQVLFYAAVVLFVARDWLSTQVWGAANETFSFGLPVVLFLVVATQYRKIEIRVPASKAAIAVRGNAAKLTAFVIVMILVAGLIPVAGVYLTFWMPPQVADRMWIVCGLLMLVPVGGILWGLIASFRRSRKIKIGQVKGKFAWLVNADPDYLDRLAPWIGPPAVD